MIYCKQNVDNVYNILKRKKEIAIYILLQQGAKKAVFRYARQSDVVFLRH